MSTLFKKDLPLEVFESDPIYIVKGVAPKYIFVNGNRTDDIEGFIYDCVNTGTYDLVRIFVEGGKKPIVTNDELLAIQENGEHVFAEFENARIRPYFSTKTKQLEDSIKANSVRIVKNE